MKSLKYIIETWGCQMNEEDSEKLSGILKRKGYIITKKREDADIIIFNTCAVRENAELKVHGNINLLKLLKEKNPNLILGVCGCMMQQKGVGEKIMKRYPFLDMVFGTHNAYKFPEYLNRVMQGDKVIEILDEEEGIVEGVPVDRKSSVKAFVTIMYGCNNYCTYCVVPYVRGKERSRKKENIINEIKELISNGYKEITLIGQNVNSYGKDLETKYTFANLLVDVSKIPDLIRLKFMTSHPKDLSDDVIEAIRTNNNICNYVHLPVQSGSSSLLKKMNRKYTREEYINLAKKIKERIPGVAISTDIIVGFPGETEEEFCETITLCEEIEFDLAFTYLYSKRGNTPAEKMEGHIDEKIKHDRFDRLIAVTNKIASGKNKEYDGKIVEILVEGKSKNDTTRMMGRTQTSKLVNFKGNAKIGDLVLVKIIKANSFSLIGEEIE